MSDEPVELTELDFGDHFTALAEWTVDVQFVRLPVPMPGGTRVEVLSTEPRLMALPRQHPLARSGRLDPVSEAELRAQPFFRLPDSVPRDWVDHFTPWGTTAGAQRIRTWARFCRWSRPGWVSPWSRSRSPS